MNYDYHMYILRFLSLITRIIEHSFNFEKNSQTTDNQKNTTENNTVKYTEIRNTAISLKTLLYSSFIPQIFMLSDSHDLTI